MNRALDRRRTIKWSGRSNGRRNGAPAVSELRDRQCAGFGLTVFEIALTVADWFEAAPRRLSRAGGSAEGSPFSKFVLDFNGARSRRALENNRCETPSVRSFADS